jgi:MFS transporter, DHA1 family, tetracycline resistance protein
LWNVLRIVQFVGCLQDFDDAIRYGMNRSGGIVFILITLFLDVLGVGLIIPVLPELVKQMLGGDESTAAPFVGLIAAAYAVSQFLFSPILGSLSDRFGRRPVLLISLFGLGVDYIIQGLATSIGWLFFGRVMAGVMGASISTANAYIADISNDDNRARNFGLIGVTFGLGFIFGPTLGGMLGGIHLRLPFFVAASLAILNWMYGYFVLPESLPPERRESFSFRGLSPLDSLRLIRSYPLVSGLAIVFALRTLAQRGLENTWVLYTAKKFAWDEQTNGWVLGWVGLTALIVQGGLVRPVIKRLGERKTLLVGTAISAVAFFGYGFATEGWMLPLIISLGGIGGLAGPASQSLLTSTVKNTEHGRVQGAMTSLQGFISILAPMLFTTGLFTYFSRKDAWIYFPGAPFIVGGTLIAIAWVIALVVVKRFPRSSVLSQDSRPLDS